MNNTGTLVYLTYQTTGAIAGTVKTSNSAITIPSRDIVVCKLNGTTGNTQWAKQNNSFNNDENANSPTICTDEHGNNCIVAYYSQFGLNTDKNDYTPVICSDTSCQQIYVTYYTNSGLVQGGSSDDDLTRSYADINGAYSCANGSGLITYDNINKVFDVLLATPYVSNYVTEISFSFIINGMIV